MKTPVPTVLLVGFLGAGKTTLLREILPHLKDRGLVPYVLINDYQNARVDASSLRHLNEEVRAINGNCVCCDSIHELVNDLLAIPETPNRVVLIEANGTTDPFSLIEHLTAHLELRDRFGPILQVGIIDLKRWQKRSWHDELEQLQASSASHLIYTRTESESTERVARVRSDLEWLNPRAVETSAVILADELKALSDAPSRAISEGAPHAHREHSHAHHHLAHGFVAVQVELPERVAGSALMSWLRHLPASVLRVKGVCQLIELPEMHFVFQRTDDSPPQPTMFPLLAEPTVPPCAVLIGVRLDVASLQRGAAVVFGDPVSAAG
jgi:G3E family GTPase